MPKSKKSKKKKKTSAAPKTQSAPKPSLRIESPRGFQLAPGLKVITERHVGSLSAAVGIFVHCGSRHETPKLHGATHLAEHLFFKGTSKYNAEELSAQLERYGGELNAFTDRELTGFHAVVPVDQIEMALELLFEMLYDSLFLAKEFERERSVVIQELSSYADSPDEEFSDQMLEVALRGHALGRRIAGFPKVVSEFKHRQIVSYIADVFLRSEMVVSVVSPLKAERVRQILRGILSRAENWRWGERVLEKRRAPVRSVPDLPADFHKRSRTQRFDSDQVQFAFFFPASSMRDRSEPAWSALANLLGGGSSSKLFREVREKRGLAYTTQAQLYSFSDMGLLGGYVATNPKRWLEAVSVVGEACRSFSGGVAREDLDFVKSMMMGTVYMGYDGIYNRMESLARQVLLLGRVYTVKQALAEVEAITKAEIDKLAKTLAGTPCFTAFGPVSPRDVSRALKAWRD